MIQSGNPRHLRQAERALKRAQRALSRQTRGSNRYRRACATIDQLMLEHCPDEMTPEQIRR